MSAVTTPQDQARRLAFDVGTLLAAAQWEAPVKLAALAKLAKDAEALRDALCRPVPTTTLERRAVPPHREPARERLGGFDGVKPEALAYQCPTFEWCTCRSGRCDCAIDAGRVVDSGVHCRSHAQED